MSIPRDNTGGSWRSPAGIAFAVFVAIAGFLLASEHWAHILGAAPLLLFLAVCIGMHFFMHGGHGGHGGHGSEGDRDTDPGAGHDH